MLHEDIRSVAKALHAHKDGVADHDGDTWKLLHNAAANLEGLADSAEQLEAHFVPKDRCSSVAVSSREVRQ